MGQAVRVTNLDYSAPDLRRLTPKQKDGQVVRRLLALALILEGKSRTQAAQQSGMIRFISSARFARPRGIGASRSSCRRSTLKR